MAVQLFLLDDPAPEWKIPEVTREIGRRGLADARAVLRSIPRRDDTDDGSHDGSHDDHHHPAAA